MCCMLVACYRFVVCVIVMCDFFVFSAFVSGGVVCGSVRNLCVCVWFIDFVEFGVVIGYV